MLLSYTTNVSALLVGASTVMPAARDFCFQGTSEIPPTESLYKIISCTCNGNVFCFVVNYVFFLFDF